MTNIILVTSEKGGQGKSVVCKCLADYSIRQNKPLTIFDTDSTNPDVYRAYPDRAQLALFSEAEALQDYANAIIEAAVDTDVMVNCRASIFLALRHWFENNNILELTAEEDMKFIMAFVTDGEPESLAMLKENLKYFRDRVRHVIFRNHGTARIKDMQMVWRTFNQDSDLQRLIEDCNAIVLDFPAMYGNSEMLTIKEQNLSFWKASQSPEFKLIPRKRIQTFLSEAFKVIAQGGFFSFASSIPTAQAPTTVSTPLSSQPATGGFSSAAATSNTPKPAATSFNTASATTASPVASKLAASLNSPAASSPAPSKPAAPASPKPAASPSEAPSAPNQPATKPTLNSLGSAPAAGTSITKSTSLTSSSASSSEMASSDDTSSN